MDKKLTDAEIMEALKHCASGEHCRFCRFRGVTGTVSDCSKKFLDLINRQKAEIERLKEEKARVHKVIPKMIKTAKSEAYQEFVNKIKIHAYYIDFPKEHRVVDEDDIDNSLKELAGDSNAKEKQ